MKLINFFTTFVFFISTIFVASAPVTSNEVKFPSYVNTKKGVLYASTAVKSGGGELLNDYPLKDCRYNFSEKRVYCNLIENKNNKYNVIFKLKPKNSCAINSKTTLQRVYTLDEDNETNNYIIEYKKGKNNKINVNYYFSTFSLKTSSCKLVLNVTGVSINKVN